MGRLDRRTSSLDQRLTGTGGPHRSMHSLALTFTYSRLPTAEWFLPHHYIVLIGPADHDTAMHKHKLPRFLLGICSCSCSSSCAQHNNITTRENRSLGREQAVGLEE